MATVVNFQRMNHIARHAKLKKFFVPHPHLRAWDLITSFLLLQNCPFTSINEEESELKIVHALIKLSRWLPNIFVMNKRQKWKSENFLWHQQHSSKSKSSSSAMIVKIFSCLVENVRVKVLKCFHSFPIKLYAELLARHRWFTQIMYIEMSQIIERECK